MQNPPEKPDPDLDLLKSHTRQLSEHFDTVQILVTRLDPDGATTYIEEGSGNLFARSGHALAWSQSELNRYIKEHKE